MAAPPSPINLDIAPLPYAGPKNGTIALTLGPAVRLCGRSITEIYFGLFPCQAHGSEKRNDEPRTAVTTTKLDSDARGPLLEAAEQCLRKHLRRPLDAAGGGSSWHAAKRDSLSLRLQGRAGAGTAGTPEPAPARTAGGPVPADLPLWKRWEKACDYLDEDLASGYVRVLQEMIAAGWSNPGIAAGSQFSCQVVRADQSRRQGGHRAFGPVGNLNPDYIGCLVGNAFLAAKRCCCWASRRKDDPPRLAPLRGIATGRRETR